MGFRSYIRQFLGAILMLFRPSLPWGFAAGSGSILGVAACHRSSRSRSSSSSRKQEEKVATIIFFYRFQTSSCSSSSRRKQEEKVAKIIFFFMGFRSYIRQFLGGILMLFRPSLPWDLLLGVVRFLASQRATGVAGAGAAAAAGGNRRKKKLKSSFSIGFRSYIRQFLGVLHCHGDLLLGVDRF